MRNPSISLVAAALLAAVSASAQLATPGTAAPHSSGDWGREGPEGVQARAADILKKLLAAAKDGFSFTVKHKDKDGKEKETAKQAPAYAKTPKLIMDLDNEVLAGSPAVAFSAGLGLNAPGGTIGRRTVGGSPCSDNDLVYTTRGLYRLADQAEAAVFIAHELGHLALGHAKIMEDRKKVLVDQLYTKWESEHTVPDDPTAAAQAFFRDMAGELQKELGITQAPLEEEADAYGRELADKAKFPREAAENGFKRAQDWLWVHKLEMGDPNHGGTVADRAKESAKWAARKKEDDRRLETTKRRQKCAAEGRSE